MSIKINKAAYDHAAELIKGGLEVEHSATNWDEVKPDADEMARYLNTHSLEEYGLWFLGIDTDADEQSKDKFVYPYGDFNVVQKSGLIVAEQQATHNKAYEVKSAAQRLLDMLNNKK